jgi:hypothetical protein
LNVAEKKKHDTPSTARLQSAFEALKQFLYGATGYEFARHALQMKREAQSLFMLVTLGQLVGVPVIPPVYTLHLLPYLTADLQKWKRDVTRKREFWEKEEFDLHGV